MSAAAGDRINPVPAGERMKLTLIVRARDEL